MNSQSLRHRCKHEVKTESVNTAPECLLSYHLCVVEGFDKCVCVCVCQVGVVHLQWEEASAVVSTCNLAGVVTLWDARSGVMMSEYRGHSAEILDFVLNRLVC